MGKVKVAVVGSINMDVVNRVQKHPLPGETIHGQGTEYHFGGKGANQAVAAARAGGQVAMVGAVGADSFGGELVEGLRKSGVGTEGVSVKEGTSGLAFITVDEAGENSIILSAGANGQVTVDDVRAAWGEVACVLVQNEIPWETTRFVLEEGKRRGVRTFFNPAPAVRVPGEVLRCVDVLVLNETEAEAIAGTREEEEAVRRLLAEGVGCVVLTLGEKGSLYADAQGTFFRTEAFSVQAVDTTAAGDTFTGALAVALGEGMEARDAVRFASGAAAIAVTRHGAQGSIPSRVEMEDMMKKEQP